MQLYYYDSADTKTQFTAFTNQSDGSFSLTMQVKGSLVIKPATYNNFTPKTGQKEYASTAQNVQFAFRSSSAPVEGNVGIIEGDVYHDSNRNGVRDSNESSIYFYKLYLVDNQGGYHNTIEDAQTTDPGGHFKFINLPLGTYTVKLSSPSADYTIFKDSVSVTLTGTSTTVSNLQVPVYKNN